MTSQERVMAALNFKQPDQVPIDFNGHRSSGISVGAYKKLREYLNLAPSQLYVYDVVQQLAIVEQDVLDLFKVDTLQLGCDLLANPERLHLYLDALVAKHMTELKSYLDAVGGNIDIIGFSDDMGTQTGPQFSPEVYMEFFYPREKKMWSYVHERFPEMKICLHCCGGVRPLLPLLADAGLNAVNPVQFTCKDMGIKELKSELYGKLALWGGGCDTRTILPKGYPLTIAPHVREQLEILNEGGGFVFQQVHNILDDVPPENIKAMYEAVHLFNEAQG